MHNGTEDAQGVCFNVPREPSMIMISTFQACSWHSAAFRFVLLAWAKAFSSLLHDSEDSEALPASNSA